MRPIVIPCCLTALLLLTGTASADEPMGIMLHIGDIRPNPCQLTITRNLVHVMQPVLSTPDGPFYFAYLIACNGPDSAGIGGMECGIDYDGGYSPEGGPRRSACSAGIGAPTLNSPPRAGRLPGAGTS